MVRMAVSHSEDESVQLQCVRMSQPGGPSECASETKAIKDVVTKYK